MSKTTYLRFALLMGLLLNLTSAFAQEPRVALSSWPNWKIDSKGDTLVRECHYPPTPQTSDRTAYAIAVSPICEWVSKKEYDLRQPAGLTRKQYNELLQKQADIQQQLNELALLLKIHIEFDTQMRAQKRKTP